MGEKGDARGAKMFEMMDGKPIGSNSSVGTTVPDGLGDTVNGDMFLLSG